MANDVVETQVPEIVESNDVPKLLPKVVEFTVEGDEEEGTADETFKIGRFSFAKTLLMMEYLGELGQRVDVASIFVQRDGQTMIGIDSIVEKIPVLMRTMRPTMVRVLALTLMKNRDVEKAIDEEHDMDDALKPYKATVNRMQTTEATHLLQLAVERMGISDIRKSFPTLLAALNS